ncbi:MAG: hypothetical protein CMJ29_00105 [Phycisphaerae bacterium]|nr:hypothetical protein [Phycisphaerae bacterium]
MRRLKLFIAVFGLLSPLAGCYRPLFDDKLPRNQFAAHDSARDGEQPTETTDAFGTPQPALRQRLMND